MMRHCAVEDAQVCAFLRQENKTEHNGNEQGEDGSVSRVVVVVRIHNPVGDMSLKTIGGDADYGDAKLLAMC